MSCLVRGEHGDMHESFLHRMKKRDFFAISYFLKDKRMGEVVNHR